MKMLVVLSNHDTTIANLSKDKDAKLKGLKSSDYDSLAAELF